MPTALSLHSARALDLLLCEHSERTLSKNLTLQYRNTLYQLQHRGAGYHLRGAKVTVCEGDNGEVVLLAAGKELPYTTYTRGLPPCRKPRMRRPSMPRSMPPWGARASSLAPIIPGASPRPLSPRKPLKGHRKPRGACCRGGGPDSRRPRAPSVWPSTPTDPFPFTLPSYQPGTSLSCRGGDISTLG